MKVLAGLKAGMLCMNGRRLNAEPTAKGIYYNKGKRVMVK